MEDPKLFSSVRRSGRLATALVASIAATLGVVTAVHAQTPLDKLSSAVDANEESTLPRDGERGSAPAAVDPDFNPDGGGKDDGGSRSDGGKAPEVATDVTGKAFFKSEKEPKLSFTLDPPERGYFDDHDVVAKVDLEHKRDGKEVRRWKLPVRDTEPHGVRWDGTKQNGKLSNPGKYQFKVTLIVDGKTAGTSSKKGGNVAATRRFDFYTHRFPVPAKHQYGDGFGAGRGHQGQDVFAGCGKPLLAARGGEVQANQFQSSAGFYIVIDGAKTGEDYFYAHMKKRSKLDVGDNVKTGEQIGFIGESGNASGCHVHFEMWTSPGWYEGGKAFDPTKQLKGWDKFS